MKYAQINLRLPLAEKTSWEHEAAKDERPLSSWIRRACRNALEWSPDPVERLEWNLSGDSDAAITFRSTPVEREAWNEKARAENRTLTAWVRRACYYAIAGQTRKKTGKS